MNHWRGAPEEEIRAVLADTRCESPLVSADRLRELGYEMPGQEEARAQARSDARDSLFLARLPRDDAEAEAS